MYLNTLAFLIAWSVACNALQTLPVERNGKQSGSTFPFSHRSAPTTFVGAVTDEIEGNETPEANKSINKEAEATLTLRDEISVSSNELPMSSIDDVSEFFQSNISRDLLVTGGGERPCTEVNVTPETFNDWKGKCSALGACQPDKNDSILSIVTGGIEFPGLKVKSNVLIGAKYVEREEKEDRTKFRRYPFYEFVLLTSDQSVSGLAPAVWIFNKLTGADKNDNDGKSKLRSLSTVTYEETENGDILFRTDALLSIDVSFPKFLLKILPGDKKTIEEKGSQSITKTLNKDVSQSLKALEKAYLEKFGF
mmetsp:Transcript_852/g.2062  ORF Transcript_852/g.2062 Transcript_852/m.2062 type:complete len:308 (-) Transcript_852:1454-2377(-)